VRARQRASSLDAVGRSNRAKLKAAREEVRVRQVFWATIFRFSISVRKLWAAVPSGSLFVDALQPLTSRSERRGPASATIQTVRGRRIVSPSRPMSNHIK